MEWFIKNSIQIVHNSIICVLFKVHSAQIMKTASTFLVISTLFLLTGCALTSGEFNTTEFAKLSSAPCIDKPTNVELFFEDEKIDFEYEKVGFIETTGDNRTKNETMLNQLKYEAYKNCADAVISIKREYNAREQGTVYNNDTKEIYSAVIFTGIAVKIKQDSAFIAANDQTRVDTTFLNTVKKEKIKNSKEITKQMGFSLVSVTLAIVFLLVYLGQ